MFNNAISQQRLAEHRRVLTAKFIADNPNTSCREVARKNGVNVSTVSRWLADAEFQSYVEMFRDKTVWVSTRAVHVKMSRVRR
jgi:DNA-binding transcriptional regulator YhcF (GntR family)